jgi:GT2 family glycosyltransferase
MSSQIDKPIVSIVILTYNRPDEIRNNVEKLLVLNTKSIEIIVVDNASEVSVKTFLPADDRLKLIELEKNIGVGGRNVGILEATGEIVITLDDDVTGITDNAIKKIINQFNEKDVAAVNFKVIDEKTHEITNWCHHRKKEIYANSVFDTYEISEGAVAFRKDILIEAGLYPRFFFISHEGPDLAIRIMDLGYRVIYNPAVTVKHSHCQIARVSWRRYYYDTRNVIWLAMRSFPLLQGARIIIMGVGPMLVYSLRDGYFRYWCKGVYESIYKLRLCLQSRKRISNNTLEKYNTIRSFNPSIVYLVKQRLFKKSVTI